eukprot:Gb_17191 [translate_table: standard]
MGAGAGTRTSAAFMEGRCMGFGRGYNNNNNNNNDPGVPGFIQNVSGAFPLVFPSCKNYLIVVRLPRSLQKQEWTQFGVVPQDGFELISGEMGDDPYNGALSSYRELLMTLLIGHMERDSGSYAKKSMNLSGLKGVDIATWSSILNISNTCANLSKPWKIWRQQITQSNFSNNTDKEVAVCA